MKANDISCQFFSDWSWRASWRGMHSCKTIERHLTTREKRGRSAVTNSIDRRTWRRKKSDELLFGSSARREQVRRFDIALRCGQKAQLSRWLVGWMNVRWAYHQAWWQEWQIESEMLDQQAWMLHRWRDWFWRRHIDADDVNASKYITRRGRRDLLLVETGESCGNTDKKTSTFAFWERSAPLNSAGFRPGNGRNSRLELSRWSSSSSELSVCFTLLVHLF